MSSLISFLQHQPMFTGLVGATITGGLLFALRQLPKQAFDLIQRLCTITLIIEQREEAFLFVTTWLARHESVKRAKRLMLAEAYDYASRRWTWRITLGRGWHMIHYRGALLFVHRELQEGGQLEALLGSGRTQRLWLVTLGWSQQPITDLIDEARRAYHGDGLVNVHVFHQGGWICTDRRYPRAIDTVFMPAAQKARVTEDVARFLSSRETYHRRGVPWRRGYLFKGPPGTGKTTLIFAIASLFSRPVFAINLNNIAGDNELMFAFNQIDADGIVVIEDIDTAKITRDREVAKVEAASTGGLSALAAEPKGVTLSGLLNAFDGLAAREGRLLFVTSNHAEQIDPALLRPGRIDLVETIAPLGHSEALAMTEAFDADPALLARLALPIAAAELQGILLSGQLPDGAPALRLVEPR